MTNSWNAKTYSLFLAARTRPARDLLAAIPNSFQPRQVYDLGCGPGNSTILLKDRWPDAKIIGLDSSADMLQEAKKCYPDLDFVQADITHFSPPEKIDLIFANAALQWLDNHQQLIPKLLHSLNTGGALAIQMPNNFHAPSHQVTVRLLQNKSTWQPFLKNLSYGILTEPFYNLPWYYDLLTAAGASHIQLWQTEYVQEMADHQGIFDWVKGTGLQPVLSAMDAENQAQFAHAYVEAISKEYPVQANNKILLSFRRLFMIGFKQP